MAVGTDWHDATIRQVHDLLRADPGVETLAIVGSGAASRLDVWSDLDLLLVVQPEAFQRFFPALDWLAPLGRIYAFEQHRDELRAVSRVCFEDLRRLDVILTTPAAFARPDDWSGLLADGYRLLFSRTPAVEAVLHHVPAPPSPRVASETFDTLANGFWYKGIVAVQKVVRGDLLVALHLNLELIQDCCVLAMMLRDRETGTTLHRGGGTEMVAELEATRRPGTPAGIVDSIEQTAILFDRLAARWSAGYGERRQNLLVWIEAARRVPSRDRT